MQMRSRHHRRRGFSLIELLTVIALIGILAAILMPRFWLAHDQAAYTACGQNLLTVAKALTVYSNDSQNRLPASLAGLTPGYLGVIPTCPMAESDTYSSSYEKNDNPQAFTVLCRGTNHSTTQHAMNEPWYNSGTGLTPN